MGFRSFFVKAVNSVFPPVPLEREMRRAALARMSSEERALMLLSEKRKRNLNSGSIKPLTSKDWRYVKMEREHLLIHLINSYQFAGLFEDAERVTDELSAYQKLQNELSRKSAAKPKEEKPTGQPVTDEKGRSEWRDGSYQNPNYFYTDIGLTIKEENELRNSGQDLTRARIIKAGFLKSKSKGRKAVSNFLQSRLGGGWSETNIRDSFNIVKRIYEESQLDNAASMVWDKATR